MPRLLSHNSQNARNCSGFCLRHCSTFRIVTFLCGLIVIAQLLLVQLVPSSDASRQRHPIIETMKNQLSHKQIPVAVNHNTIYQKRTDLYSNNNQRKCAINFWGLPRAFESLVLPSIEENILKINAKYNCDYFVHFYILKEEVAGRSGGGGHIDPYEVYKLTDAVARHSYASSDNNNKPAVSFVSTQDQEFWTKYQPLIDKIRNTVDEHGKHLYFPDNAKTYTFPTTTDNIIKMWHTIEESWNLMEQYERTHNITYDRVAMLRNDVVYMTPIDIYQTRANKGGSQKHDTTTTTDYNNNNNVAVIPGFGRHPVSDRLIYGPRRAVQVWAAQRFSRMEQHVQWIHQHDPGWGLHSERFVNYTLFSAIRDRQVSVVEHDTICFFRARSDESVWISDCDGTSAVTLPSIQEHLQSMGPSKKDVVERILKRKCGQVTTRKKPYAQVLTCPRKTVAVK